MTRTLTETLPRRRHITPRAGILRWIMAALDVWISRRRLASLDDHLLRDVGLSAGDARTEANRPIWDVPAHWLK